MLGEDQQRVAERARPEPSSELQRTLPILTRHKQVDRSRQPLMELFELRVARSPCLLVRRHL